MAFGEMHDQSNQCEQVSKQLGYNLLLVDSMHCVSALEESTLPSIYTFAGYG